MHRRNELRAASIGCSLVGTADAAWRAGKWPAQDESGPVWFGVKSGAIA